MKIKLQEAISLSMEINGTKDYKGLVSQKLSFKNKFLLNKIYASIEKDLKLFDDTKKELFEKYGEKDGENITIAADKFPSFAEEFNPLLEVEVEVNANGLKLEDIESLETEEYYPTLVKLLQ